MPNPLQSDAVADMAIMVLKDLGRPNYNEIASDYQQYVGFNDLLRQKRRSIEGGRSVQRQIMVDVPDNASAIGAFATLDSNAGDMFVQTDVPHRIYATSYAIDEYLLQQASPSALKIVDMIQASRNGGMASLAYFTEPRIWLPPADSTDTKHIYGFKYWIMWNATEGFQGGAASGHTLVGNVSPTTYPNWRNYTRTYAAVTEDDLLDEWRIACDLTEWMPPVEIPEYQGGGMDFAHYTDQTTRRELIKLTRAQNENLGLELYNYRGLPLWRGAPVKWVPAFEDTNVIASGSNPIYGINWKTFEMSSLSGFYMRETPPIRPSNQPLVRVVYIFLAFNINCTNRRKNYVIAKVDPAV